MKKTPLFILLLLIGSASAAIYIGYNYKADTSVTVPYTGTDGIETLVKCSGGWTNSCGYPSANSNETVTFQFRHENIYDHDLVGSIFYEIECNPNLITFENGTIENFKGVAYYDGIRLFCTGGSIYSCNDYGHIQIDEHGIATINIEKSYTFEPEKTEYTTLELTFNENIHGSYKIRSYVEVAE